MAAAFPNSTFEGFDPSRHAIDRARARLADTGLTNVQLHVAAAADLPAVPTYDFVLTLDCIHDMPQPGGSHRRHPRPPCTMTEPG